MRHWWQLATRNWWSGSDPTGPRRTGRTVATVVSVLLGVAAVVVITSLQNSAEMTLDRWITQTLFGGQAQVSIHPPGAHWGTLPAQLAASVARLDEVSAVTARLKRRLRAEPASPTPGQTAIDIDAVGINAATEGPFLRPSELQGRLPRPGERGVAVLEETTARGWQIGLGDQVRIFSPKASAVFEVVGLIPSPRIAAFQHSYTYVPIEDVRELRGEPGAASVIHIHTGSDDPDTIRAAASAVETLLKEQNLPYRVESVAAQQELLAQMRGLAQLASLLAACIVLLTAFFIIVTTMSAGLAQRQAELGTLRCVGLTRGQLVGLVSLELLPLGVLGTLLGLAVGWSVTAGLIPRLAAVGEFIPRVEVTGWALGLAAASGLLTTLLATALLAVQVARLAPLSAVHAEARAASPWWAALAAVVGLGLIVLTEGVAYAGDPERWLHPAFATLGVLLPFAGYALLAPGLILVVGQPLARGVAVCLRLTPTLAGSALGLGRSYWRSAGVCWTLLVGISLIAYVGTRTNSFIRIWDFPASLPDTFVWSENYVPAERAERVRSLPAVHDTALLTDLYCELEPVRSDQPRALPSVVDMLLKRFTNPVFVAGEPGELLPIMKIDLAEGDWTDAAMKLQRGGYVLIPTQTAKQHDLGVGDRVRISARGRSAEFEVAGVAHSPAFDLAVDFFQAGSYMEFAGASAVLGTREDLRRHFDLDVVALLLSNLDIPEAPVPAAFVRKVLPDSHDLPSVARAMLEWEPLLTTVAPWLAGDRPELEAWLADPAGQPLGPAAQAGLDRSARAFDYIHRRWRHYTAEEDWYAFRERLVLFHIADVLQRPDAIVGSLERLAAFIHEHLQRGARLATWVPSVALVVAILGIANLMLVTVRARARELAVLRAIGAVRSQIIRLVLTEAITLGLLGSAIGLTLGIRLAVAVERMVSGLIGYEAPLAIPYGTLAAATGLTVGICVLAGLPPARQAARASVVDALQSA